jgi:hypothetical protein
MEVEYTLVTSASIVRVRGHCEVSTAKEKEDEAIMASDRIDLKIIGTPLFGSPVHFVSSDSLDKNALRVYFTFLIWFFVKIVR